MLWIGLPNQHLDLWIIYTSRLHVCTSNKIAHISIVAVHHVSDHISNKESATYDLKLYSRVLLQHHCILTFTIII